METIKKEQLLLPVGWQIHTFLYTFSSAAGLSNSGTSRKNVVPSCKKDVAVVRVLDMMTPRGKRAKVYRHISIQSRPPEKVGQPAVQ